MELVCGHEASHEAGHEAGHEADHEPLLAIHFIECIYNIGLRQPVDGYLVRNRSHILLDYFLRHPNHVRIQEFLEGVQRDKRRNLSELELASRQATLRKWMVRKGVMELTIYGQRLFKSLVVKADLAAGLRQQPAIIFDDWQELFDMYFLDKRYELVSEQVLMRHDRPRIRLYGRYRNATDHQATADDRLMSQIAIELGYPCDWQLDYDIMLEE